MQTDSITVVGDTAFDRTRGFVDDVAGPPEPDVPNAASVNDFGADEVEVSCAVTSCGLRIWRGVKDVSRVLPSACRRVSTCGETHPEIAGSRHRG